VQHSYARYQTTFTLRVSEMLDQDYFDWLQQKLRHYNRQTAPQMEPPEARPLNICVEDGAGRPVGGLAAVTYWNWLVIKLLVLDDSQRGNGLGQRLLERAHEVAIARGCAHAQTMTYDFQALAFYRKHGYSIAGELKDYPEGYNYYWLRKDFEVSRQ
jgi:GNAT superfamily N-acetyltransferase